MKRSIGDFLIRKLLSFLETVKSQHPPTHFFRVADYTSVELNGSGDCFECRKFEYCALAMSLSKVLPR